MFKASVVYMFHAIGDVLPGDIADKHYSFSEEKFREFVRQSGRVSSLADAIKSPRSSQTICTFDDGHLSNYKAALFLAENQYGSADFFVNPAMVGQKNFMDWHQLSEIANAGMSVQSHSYEHVYLSDLTEEEQYQQLYRSRVAIEDKLGVKVSIIAPPGGRFNTMTLKAAKRAGYTTLAGSVPGRWQDDVAYVKRVPVMQGNSVAQLLSCTQAVSSHLLRLQAKYYAMYTVKKVLGNGTYDVLRKRVLG